jgi:hypothetical protein
MQKAKAQPPASKTISLFTEATTSLAIYTPHPLASKAIAQSTTINSSVLCATAHGITA